MNDNTDINTNINNDNTNKHNNKHVNDTNTNNTPRGLQRCISVFII